RVLPRVFLPSTLHENRFARKNRRIMCHLCPGTCVTHVSSPYSEAKRSDRLPGRPRLGHDGEAATQATAAPKLDGKRSESASRVSVIFAIKLRKKTLTLVASDEGLRLHEKANRAAPGLVVTE
ncbi:MAG: hypothetical protein ACI9ZF_003615, partial [Bradyrhizobium sp.]